MKNTIRVSYRLPIEVAKLIDKEAERSRRTKTAVLIIAIESYLESLKPVDTKTRL